MSKDLTSLSKEQEHFPKKEEKVLLSRTCLVILSTLPIREVDSNSPGFCEKTEKERWGAYGGKSHFS
jgi:hypothetical protein